MSPRVPIEELLRRIAFFTLACAAVALPAGCQKPCICVSDGVTTPAGDVVLSASVDRHPDPDRTVGIPGVDVTFFHKDRPLGAARTDALGQARLTCVLPPGVTRFRTEARVGDETVSGEGEVFAWPPGRTVIICDIDGTISNTHYRELVFDADDRASKPIADSAQVLTELSRRFGLIYLTARPAFLREKTRRWLDAHGFPPAPLISAPTLSQSITPQTFKAMKIHELQEALGDIRIGIGDAKSDSEAYAMENLLTIMIDHNDENLFRSHAIVMQDWNMLRDFINANREVLEDPARIHAAIDRQEPILRPILKYRPPGKARPREAAHAHDAASARR